MRAGTWQGTLGKSSLKLQDQFMEYGGGISNVSGQSGKSRDLGKRGPRERENDLWSQEQGRRECAGGVRRGMENVSPVSGATASVLGSALLIELTAGSLAAAGIPSKP